MCNSSDRQHLQMRFDRWSRTLPVLLIFLCVSIICNLSHAASFGTHGVVGAALGYSLGQNPVHAFIIGFVSHALLDMMPHHDPVLADYLDLGFYSAFNVGALFTVGELYSANENDPRILWGAIGGALPDLEHILFFKACEGFDICEKKLYPTHNGLLPHPGDAPFLAGYTLEVGVCYLAIELSF